MNTSFPKPEKQFLKASDFQDQEICLVFKGWKKKANEDVKKKDGTLVTWKARLKYQMRYSYPEWALDEAGEKKLDKSGKPLRNSNYDANFPKGYSIVYLFEEGQLESGSYPLFNAFCMVQPKAGDVVSIKRTGEGQETKWKVKKHEKGEIVAPDESHEDPSINFDDEDFSGDPEINEKAYSREPGQEG